MPRSHCVLERRISRRGRGILNVYVLKNLDAKEGSQEERGIPRQRAAQTRLTTWGKYEKRRGCEYEEELADGIDLLIRSSSKGD